MTPYTENTALMTAGILITTSGATLMMAGTTAHLSQTSPTKVCLVAQITIVETMAIDITGATQQTTMTGITVEPSLCRYSVPRRTKWQSKKPNQTNPTQVICTREDNRRRVTTFRAEVNHRDIAESHNYLAEALNLKTNGTARAWANGPDPTWLHQQQQQQLSQT